MKSKLIALAMIAGALIVSPVRADDDNDAKNTTNGSLTVFINQPAAGKQAALTGTFVIKRFITSDDKKTLSAVGLLSVSDGSRSIATTLAIPVKSAEAVNPPATAEMGADATAAAVAAAASSCPVLHLVLGPLNLNLLGLNISLNQVVLDITAIPGPGNLLGNLLCDIAGLLNPGGTLAGALQNLANALNNLLRIL
jgi:hypothetical protein